MGLLNWLTAHPLPPAKFAQLVLRALQSAGLGDNVTFEVERFGLKTPGGWWDLQNAYQEYMSVPRGARKKVLQRLVDAHGASLRPWSLDEALPNLLPRLRSRTYYVAAQLLMQSQSDSNEPFTKVSCARPLPGTTLACGVVINAPSSVIEVSEKQATDWNMTEAYLHDVARRNLARISDGPFGEVAPGVFCSRWNDSHDATRVMLPEVIRRLRVQGNHVAFVPHPNLLVVTGSDNIEGLATAAQIALVEFDKPRPLVLEPLECLGNEIRLFEVDDSHSLRELFQQLRVLNRLCDANGVGRALMQRCQQREEQVVIREVQGRRCLDGRYRTVTWWHRDALAILPPADDIAFVPGPGLEGCVVVAWDQAWPLVSPLLVEEPGPDPPWWRAASFPDDALLRELEKWGTSLVHVYTQVPIL